MTNKWRQMSDDELIEEANTGLRGQGATIEMLRRMQKKGLNRVYVAIALATLVLVAVQVYLQWLSVPVQ